MKVKIGTDNAVRYMVIEKSKNSQSIAIKLYKVLNFSGYRSKICKSKTDFLLASDLDYIILQPDSKLKLPQKAVEDIAIITSQNGVKEIKNKYSVVVSDVNIKHKQHAIKSLNESFFVKIKQIKKGKIIFDYIGEKFYLNLEIKGKVEQDAINAGLAIAAVEELGVEEGNIRNGLKG